MTRYACGCPADAGRSIVCRYGSTPLQCGSGQVLVIDGAFYGRKVYHCRSKRSWLAAPPPAQCGWVEVTKSLTGTKDHMILMKSSRFVLIKCSAEAQIRGVQSAEWRMGNTLAEPCCTVEHTQLHLTQPKLWQNKYLNLLKRFWADEHSDETPLPSERSVCQGTKAQRFLTIFTRGRFSDHASSVGNHKTRAQSSGDLIYKPNYSISSGVNNWLMHSNVANPQSIPV